MNSTKTEIQLLEKELKEKKAEFNIVMDSLKKDAKEYNADSLGETARRTLCFYFGEYYKWYENDGLVHHRQFKISKGQTWIDSKENRGFVDAGFYHITNRNGDPVGFICHKEDILSTIYTQKLFKIWLWYCQEKKYTKSFDDFILECKDEKKLNFLEIFNSYLGRDHFHNNNHILEVISEPSMKIKDMLICITDLS